MMKMRILAVSDSHGNNRPIIKAIDMLKPDAVFFLGDGIKQVELLDDMYEIPFYTVKGNCDFGNYPTEQLICLDDKTFFITHGHNYYVKSGLYDITEKGREVGADVVLFGHTHTAYNHYEDGMYVMNPGSCAFPNNGKPSCGYIDIVGGSVVTNIVWL